MNLRPLLLPLGILCLASSCTITTRSHPSRIQGDGLVEGHLALGIAAEDRLIHASLFNGQNDGSVAELVLWKLFRLELGIAGASISIGPLHLGFGILAYDPEVPRMNSTTRHDRDDHQGEFEGHEVEADEAWGVEGCADCEAAKNRHDR